MGETLHFLLFSHFIFVANIRLVGGRTGQSCDHQGMAFLSVQKRIAVFCPAKLNLYLKIHARRPDGFHELETVMAPVTIFDTLELHPTPENNISLNCRWAAGGNRRREPIPDGPANLAYRAAQLLQEAANVRQGVDMRLIKRIPSAAGLGGASSNAASVLLATNEAWKVHWPLSRLTELAAQLGSDVPLFLHRCAAIAHGRGELLQPVRLPRMHFVVAKPTQGLSTASVYKNVQLEECGSQRHDAADLVAAMARGNRDAVESQMTNDLEYPAKRLSPVVSQMFAAMKDAGLRPHMSGSGTSCFAACHSAHSARRMARRLRITTNTEAFAVSTLTAC